MRAITLFLLLFSFGFVQAEEVKGKHKMVIKTDGGDDVDIAAILDSVRGKITDGAEVRVVVAKDGEVEVLEGGEMAMKTIKRKHRAHRRQMTPDVAECVLKSISKVETDAAARLLRQACEALHPAEPES